MAFLTTESTDQSNSNVGRDQAGRDIHNNTTVNNFASTRPVSLASSQVPTILQKLAKQMAGNIRHSGFIAELELYVDNRSSKTVIGLEEKLEKIGRQRDYGDARLKKEAFAKMLFKHQHWEAAQQLFAYFLSLIEAEFTRRVIPHCGKLTIEQIDEIVGKHIVDRIKDEIGPGHEELIITDLHIQGMIFWLADKCYVRWHQ
jgi:hypothetical protein